MTDDRVVLHRVWRFVAARAINTFGRAIITVTAGWELWDRTRSPFVLAGIGIMQVIPVIALFAPSGWIVDHANRRTLAHGAALGMGCVGIGLAAASAAAAPVWVYYGLLLLQGCVIAIHAPATAALLANIGPREILPRANRRLSSLSETAQIVAPLAAGLAYQYVAAPLIFGFVGLTAIASASFYRSLPSQPRPPTPAKRRDWRVGVRFIARTPLLVSALTLDMFAVLFAGVVALMPAIATELLDVGSVGFGALRASQPVGAVAMAVIGGRLRPWRHPGRVLLIVVGLYAIATVGVGLSRWLPATCLLLACCGALDNISVVIRLTLEQSVVPDAIRGRVAAVHNIFIGLSNELGAAESGLAAGLLGPAPAIVAGGAVALVVVFVVAVKWPELARMPPLAELRPDDRAE